MPETDTGRLGDIVESTMYRGLCTQQGPCNRANKRSRQGTSMQGKSRYEWYICNPGPNAVAGSLMAVRVRFELSHSL